MIFKRSLLALLVCCFISSAGYGDEIWGKFERYTTTTKTVEMENGATFSASGEYWERFFFNLQKGTPLKMKTRGKQIVEARQVSLVEFNFHYCTRGSLVTIRKGGGWEIQGELAEKTEDEIVLYPLIQGKINKNIRTRYSLSDLTYFKGRGDYSLPPSLKKNTRKIKPKEEEEAGKKVIELTPAISNQKERDTSRTGEKGEGFQKLFREWGEKGPSPLRPFFLWASGNVPLALGLMLVVLGGLIFSVANLLKKKARGKTSSGGPLENYKPQRHMVERELSLIPQRIEVNIKQGRGGGHDVKLAVFMKESVSQKKNSWEILFFLYSEEKPREFRLSKNDLSLSSPPAGGPMVTNLNLHLFTPSPEYKIFPLLVKSSSADKFRDAFMSENLSCDKAQEVKGYNRLHEILKAELHSKNFPIDDVITELVM